MMEITGMEMVGTCLDGAWHVMSVMGSLSSDLRLDSDDVMFSDWEVVRYYLYLYSTRFADFPWVVRTAYTIVCGSALGLLALTLSAVVRIYTTDRRARYQARIKRKYGERLSGILTDSQPHDEADIADEIGRNGRGGRFKELKKWQARVWLEWLESLKEQHGQDLSEDNLLRVIDVLMLRDYVERRVRFGRKSRRVATLRSSDYLGMAISASSVAGMLNDRNESLRKAVRLHYMRYTADDPFRYMVGNSKGTYCKWDGVELHQLFADFKAQGKPFPSFQAFLPTVTDDEMGAFLIGEVAYWGNEHDMEAVESLFTSPKPLYREAAFRSVGTRRWTRAVPRLMAVYQDQPEPLRQVILAAIQQIGCTDTADTAHFLASCYADASSDRTRLAALRGLWLGGTEGQAAFMRLKAEAAGEDRLRLFHHVENPLVTPVDRPSDRVADTSVPFK